MSQKEFKRLRRLARELGKIKNPSSALPEAYTQDGKRVLNPGKHKGTYKWLKKNHQLTKKSSRD